MKWPLALPLAVLTAQPAIAQEQAPPNPDWNCDDPIAQQEMNWCAWQDFEAADDALNIQWLLTVAEMRRRDRLSGEGVPKGEGHFETLLAAQRAWISFRDKHCASEGYLFRGGSMEPLIVATCKTDLTKQRTQQLRDLAETF